MGRGGGGVDGEGDGGGVEAVNSLLVGQAENNLLCHYRL